MDKRTRIVVADDNRDAADSLAQILGLMGHAAFAVYDGRQAVAACRERQPALVILDVQMPIMGGIEAARAIRAEGRPGPVIASLTAVRGRQQPDDVDWQAFDFHLSKPLELAELEILLATTRAAK
jgi:CheY-like chemotaxis protein